MKKISLILLFLALLFGALTTYFMFYAESGADGLSSFIPLVFCGVLFLCFLIAFLLSFLLKKEQSSRSRNWIIAVALLLPIIGLLSVSGVFSGFSYDYQEEWEVQIEKDKSVLTTKEFKNEDIGMVFHHVSGNVTTYENGTPISTPITPKIKEGRLLVPVDDDSYHQPDMFFKVKMDSAKSIPVFLEGLEKELGLKETKFEHSGLEVLSKLPQGTEVWSLQGHQIGEMDGPKLLAYFSLVRETFPELVYFIRQPKQPEQVYILVVSDLMLSAPAFVVNMSTSNFKNHNLWFHTLEFLD